MLYIILFIVLPGRDSPLDSPMQWYMPVHIVNKTNSDHTPGISMTAIHSLKGMKSKKDIYRSLARKKTTEQRFHRQDPYEPNNTPGTAYPISYNDTLRQGIVEPPGDIDYFKFAGNANDTVTIDIDASIYGSWLDSYLVLYDIDSVTILAENDDWHSLDSRIMNFILPSPGIYFISVTDLGYNGGPDYFYHIWITDVPMLFGAISGMVTDSITGVPIPDVYIDVIDTSYYYYSSGYTDSSGYYIVGDLPTGVYKLSTWNWSGYLDKWYNNKPDFYTADPVNVTTPDTTANIDFQLTVGGCISGTVTDSVTGQPIYDVYIDVYDSAYNWVSSGWTDFAGDYVTTQGLRSGNYRLFAYNFAGYVYEWYNNKLDFFNADPVNVTVPDTTANIDFQLALGGNISGTVTDSMTGQPIFDVYIDVFDSNYNSVSFGFTDASGRYLTIMGLRAGSYKLCTYNYTGYIDEWYRNKLDFYSADPVNVIPPDTTERIDFDLSGTGAEENRAEKIHKFALDQSVPNPMAHKTIIRYSLDKETKVSLRVYNILGQNVATLVDGVQPPGIHYAYWYGKDKQGRSLPAGIYFYQLDDGKVRQTKKLIIIKDF